MEWHGVGVCGRRLVGRPSRCPPHERAGARASQRAAARGPGHAALHELLGAPQEPAEVVIGIETERGRSRRSYAGYRVRHAGGVAPGAVGGGIRQRRRACSPTSSAPTATTTARSQATARRASAVQVRARAIHSARLEPTRRATAPDAAAVLSGRGACADLTRRCALGARHRPGAARAARLSMTQLRSALRERGAAGCGDRAGRVAPKLLPHA